MSEKKIVSLLPAATEIVCALGLEEQLAGRSHECDYPESVKKLPACTAPRISSDASSSEIDRRVKEALKNAVSLYSIDEKLLNELRPDVLITQDQCEVCAVSLKDVETAMKGITGTETTIISLHPVTLKEVFGDISLIASTFGVSARAEVLLEDLEERMNIIRHKLKFVDERPSVVCMEWLSPLMIAGNWTPDLITLAGGTPVLAESGKHSQYIPFEQIKAADPDIIVVAACGFTVERTLKEISLLPMLPGWEELTAVKNNRVYIADGNRYFNRPGPVLVDTAEMLAEIIHPKQFVFGMEGKAWLKFGV